MKEQQNKTLVQLHPEESRTTQPGERIVADLLERIKNRKLAKSQVLGKMIRSTVLMAGLLVWACLSAQATSPGVAFSPAQSYAAPALTTAADCPDPLAILRTMTVVDVVFEGRHTFRLASGGTSSYSTIALADACVGSLDRSDFGPSANAKWEGRSFSQDASVAQDFGGQTVARLTLRGNGTIAADGRSLEALDLSLTPWYTILPGVPATPARSRRFVLTGPIPLTACSADAVEFSVTGAVVPPRIAQVVAANAVAFYDPTPRERYESTDWGAAPTPKLTVRFSGPLARIHGVVAVPLTHVDSNRGFPAAVRQSEQAPLADVKVELVRLRRDNTGQYVVDAVLASMNTQPDGAYSLGAPVDPSLAIRVRLQGEAVRVFDASAAQPGLGYKNAPPYLPAPATDVEIISAPFAVTAADRLLRRDILFDVGQGHTSPKAGTPAELRLSDFGLIYFHARQAWELTTMLNQALDTRPVPIYAHFPDQTFGAYWMGPFSDGRNAVVPPHIVIASRIADGIPNSHRNNSGRPDNREWHEFGHHVQADAFANLLPMATGQNHGGYKNSTSTDSWTEGFAEFYSLLINREVAKDGTPPEIYHWTGGAANLEANVLSWRYRGVSWEELAVASLLWDLADPVDARDATYLRTAGPDNLPMVGEYRDHVEVDLQTLWAHLTAQVAGNYPHILNIKQLYDVLRSRDVGQEPLGPGGMTALDEIFVAHGFFTDTGPHQFYYDAGEEVGSSGHLTVTLGTPPNQVVIPALPVRPSPPLSPEGWVRVDARDASGTPVSVSSYTVDVRFDAPFEHYNFSFEGRPIDGKLFVLTADAQYPATIAIRPNGFAAAAYTLRNDFAWNAPADANGVIAKHTFILGKLPVYLPLVMRRPAAPPTPTPTPTPTSTPSAQVGIYGRVTYNSSPAAGINLRLRFYDGSAYSTAATTQTDSQGRYVFANPWSLGASQSYYVRYGPNTSDARYLNSWYGPTIRSFTAGNNVAGGDFDLANITLSAPAPGAIVSLPVTFVWQKRSVPGDTYRLVLFDPDNNDTWTSRDLGNVDRLTITSLPDGMVTGKRYGWYVEVWQGDASYGESYYYRSVTFTTAENRAGSALAAPDDAHWRRSQRTDQLKSEEDH